MTEAPASLSRTKALSGNDKTRDVTDVTDDLQVLGSRARTHARAHARGGGTERSVTSVTSVTEELDTLADRLRRLRPDGRKPERFHQDKSEIEAALRRLAREVQNG